MEEQEQNLSPLDRAKALIDKKKDERLSQEELEKQEESTRLALLFERIENLNKDLVKIQENTSSLNTQAQGHSLQHMNQTSGMKQAIEVLKSSPEIAPLLVKDKIGEKIDHKARREIVEQVFGESKDERRLVRHDLKEVKKDISTNEKQKEKILKQIKELANSEDGKKLLESIKLEYLKAHSELKSFLDNKEKNNRSYSYEKMAKINKFTENKSEVIQQLRTRLTNAFNEILTNIESVLIKAEGSPEYKELTKSQFDIKLKDLNGKTKELTQDDMEVDFLRYPKVIPKASDLQVSVSNRNYIAFPQLDYGNGVHREIQKDIDETDSLMRATKGEINTRGDGIFSGSKKYKTLYENLDKKRQFLVKMERNIHNSFIDSKNKLFNGKAEDIHFDEYSKKEQNLSELLNDYIYQFSKDMYSLNKDESLPQYDRPITIEELFKWAKKNDIPVDWQNAHKEKEVISTKIAKLREEYETLAGKGSASGINIPGY